MTIEIKAQLQADHEKVNGLVFMSDGSSGPNKVKEALEQRRRYKKALELILDHYEEFASEWPDATVRQFMHSLKPELQKTLEV